MTTSLMDPMTAMAGGHAFSLPGASPLAGDLTWIAPLAFAAAVWIVAMVARAGTGDGGRCVETPTTAPAELRQAA